MLNWLLAVLRPKKWIPSKCLICGKPLTYEIAADLYRCPNDHRFGRDGKRESLINAGDHRGEGDQGI